jgi:hypothetical protein
MYCHADNLKPIVSTIRLFIILSVTVFVLVILFINRKYICISYRVVHVLRSGRLKYYAKTHVLILRVYVGMHVCR